jgi:hypothetical protein
MNPQNPEHITFRPGALTERLTRGPLSAGATAKSDLSRYYALVNTQFDVWWQGNAMNDDAWSVIVAFIATRGWETVPYPVPFQDHFFSFLRSPMAKDLDKQEKAVAVNAIVSASYADIVAIVDHAEDDATNLAFSTADATSAAS